LLSERPEKKKTGVRDVEEIKEIIGAVSTELPTLIKSIIAAVFSEEAGRSMGKAAAAFYKELKDSGMPDNVAVKMTEDYVGVFTSLGDILKKTGPKGKVTISGEKAEELEKEIERRVKEKLAGRAREAEEEE